MNAPLKVFLAGEGKNELGGRIGSPAFHRPDQKGVLEALLQRVRANGWEVGGACEWKRIRKYKAGGGVDAETRAVLGVALDAREAKCQVLAFCRDLDRDKERRKAIEEGIQQAERKQDGKEAPLEIIGGVAVPTLEGWLLALLGQRGTEELSPGSAAKALEEKGIAAKHTEAMVAVVENANVDATPQDAASLRGWLDRAHDVMARKLP